MKGHVHEVACSSCVLSSLIVNISNCMAGGVLMLRLNVHTPFWFTSYIVCAFR